MPAFDSFVYPGEEREAGFQMSEQSYGNGRQEQQLEVFKHWNTVAHFFCCWRSKKLFLVISHLVTSSTNIVLLLAPAVVAVFLPPPQTDGSRALIIHPPFLKFAVWNIYKIVPHPCVSFCPINRVERFVEQIHWRANCQELW